MNASSPLETDEAASHSVSDSTAHPRLVAIEPTIVPSSACPASSVGRSVRNPCTWLKPSNPSLSSIPIVATISGQPARKPIATNAISSPSTIGMNHNSDTTRGPTEGIFANRPPSAASPHRAPKHERLIRTAESSDAECLNPNPLTSANVNDSPRTTSAAVMRTNITPASDQATTATRNRDQATAVADQDSREPTIWIAGFITSRSGRPIS